MPCPRLRSLPMSLSASPAKPMRNSSKATGSVRGLAFPVCISFHIRRDPAPRQRLCLTQFRKTSRKAGLILCSIWRNVVPGDSAGEGRADLRVRLHDPEGGQGLWPGAVPRDRRSLRGQAGARGDRVNTGGRVSIHPAYGLIADRPRRKCQSRRSPLAKPRSRSITWRWERDMPLRRDASETLPWQRSRRRSR